ncbi:interleukin-1 receptor-associated kinase 4-like [Aethina tumida]|uniref:interleukin-1 receptor-associated kinase 4-like n=1 Tax=Aethina tumida TaxID=116153 RepID=UPI002147ED28|nr:interleukin-1 receptor-associated kinase 4-like [Aethina tumida]
MNKMEEVTKQFCNEVETLSKFKHDHLLELLGYSHDGSTYCLAYEYMSGGTLHDKLKAQKGRLHWKERLDISLGLSQAITYLHTQFKDPVVHRDIKSPNILLDGSNKAKLGTDEALRGEISYKMDTYSFGIVLLELLTSLPVTDENRQEVCLNEHAEYQYSIDGNGCNLLDRNEEVGDWLTKEVDIGEKLIEIALKCLKKKKIRPHQKEVTENLLDLAKYM